MKKVRKINRKPAPAEKLSDESDSDEQTQPIKTGKGKNVLTMPKPRDNLDSDGPLLKSKGKKTKVSKPAQASSKNSDSEEIPLIIRKTRKKKAPAKIEPKEEHSDNADSEIIRKTKRKLNKKVSDTKEEKEEHLDNSDTEEKLPIRKKRKIKTASDTREPKKNSLDQLDSQEKPSHTSNAKGKSEKQIQTPEPAEKTTSSGRLQRMIEPEDAELSSDMELDSEAYFNPKSHEKSLRNLKAIDPDFFKFLEEHDAELLNFEADDNPLESKEDDNDSVKSDDLSKEHVPGTLLELSDESDFEAEDGQPEKGKVTLKLVNDLTVQLTTKGKPKASTIIYAAKLFHAAVQRATSEDGTSEGEFTVSGSSVFNSILSMCVLNMPPSLRKYLGMESSATDPTKCKRFTKIKATMIQYVDDAIKLLSVVTSDSILSMMLKHLHQISSFVACFPRLAKKAIKKILPLWAAADETVRVLSFVCILRITVSNLDNLLEIVLKAMHLTYVRNCKFVSPTTWPGINFMRRSLCEMYMLNLDVSYKHAFLYIRQLGIHLRNAIMVPKLEHKLAVYNWQYLNSLHLWAELIQQTVSHQGMESLYFPLSMVISNTIRLVPTPQYYPVRFYLTEVLMDMVKESGLYVPILGFMMDVLIKFQFNKRQKKVSMKPMDLSCIIRLSKSQMLENGFRDAVLERIYALLLEFLATISSCMSFPEITVFLDVQLKYLVSNSTDPNTAKKFKQLLDKVTENSEFMCKERHSCQKFIRDADAIRAWEAKIRVQSTPLMAFFENWRRINHRHKRKINNKNDELFGNQPAVDRSKVVMEEAKTVFYKDPLLTTLNILPSDSEDEKDYFQNKGIEKTPPKEKIKKKKANIKPKKKENEVPDVADAGDIVQEFSAKDW